MLSWEKIAFVLTQLMVRRTYNLKNYLSQRVHIYQALL